MPLRSVDQKPQNSSLDYDLTPDLAEKMQTRFVCRAQIRRVNNNWFVRETERVGTEECDSGEERRITTRLRNELTRLGSYSDARDGNRANALVYIPPFVVRGVSIRDSIATGRILYYDLPFYTYADDRFFAGLDRPEGITMLYLADLESGVCEANNINLKG
jgi:hypothetical protein